MKYLFLFICIHFYLLLEGQSWSTVIDADPWNPPRNDYGYEIVSYKDGYLIVSFAGCDVSDFPCTAIIFLDSLGNHTKTIRIGDDRERPFIAFPMDAIIYVDTDNSIVIAGHRLEYEIQKDLVTLLKIDSTGQILWEKNYNEDYCNNGRTFIRKDDGGFIIHCDGIKGSGNNIVDISFLETDLNGDLISTTNLNLIDTFHMSQRGNAVVMEDSSIFLVTQSLNFESEPFVPIINLIKLNKNKQIVFIKRLFKRLHCSFNLMKSPDDHLIFFACVDTLIPPYLEPLVPTIAKIDTNGNIIATTMMEVNFLRYINNVVQSENGDIYLMGYTEHPSKAYLGKFSPTLEFQWERVYTAEGFFETSSFFIDIMVGDSSITATGSIIDENAIYASTWILNLDENGCFDPSNCGEEVLVSTYSNTKIPSAIDIGVYPSPTHGIVTLKIPESINGLDLQVIDLSGRIIFQKRDVAEGESIMINQAGTHFFRFTFQNTIVATRKVVVIGG